MVEGVVPEVRLLDAPFEPGAEMVRFVAAHPRSGGIASFLGVVREEAGEGAVLALELSHYTPLTLSGMQRHAAAACARWPLDGLTVLHRVGEMSPGEPIVLVAAAARRRRPAIEAVDFVMDHLKSDSWLWKRERTAAGWQWIEPRSDDHADRARW